MSTTIRARANDSEEWRRLARRLDHPAAVANNGGRTSADYVAQGPRDSTGSSSEIWMYCEDHDRAYARKARPHALVRLNRLGCSADGDVGDCVRYPPGRIRFHDRVVTGEWDHLSDDRTKIRVRGDCGHTITISPRRADLRDQNPALDAWHCGACRQRPPVSSIYLRDTPEYEWLAIDGLPDHIDPERLPRSPKAPLPWLPDCGVEGHAGLSFSETAQAYRKRRLGGRCSECGKREPTDTYNAAIAYSDMADVGDNRRILEQYLPNAKAKVTLTCPRCGGQWSTQVVNLKSAGGCAGCANWSRSQLEARFATALQATAGDEVGVTYPGYRPPGVAADVRAPDLILRYGSRTIGVEVDGHPSHDRTASKRTRARKVKAFHDAGFELVAVGAYGGHGIPMPRYPTMADLLIAAEQLLAVLGIPYVTPSARDPETLEHDALRGFRRLAPDSASRRRLKALQRAGLTLEQFQASVAHRETTRASFPVLARWIYVVYGVTISADRLRSLFRLHGHDTSAYVQSGTEHDWNGIAERYVTEPISLDELAAELRLDRWTVRARLCDLGVTIRRQGGGKRTS